MLTASRAALATEDGIKILRKTGKAFASVAKQVSPAIVFIQAEISKPASVTTAPPGRDL